MSAVIVAAALIAGILILALVPDHRRPGVLTAVSVDEFLTAHPAAAPAPVIPPQPPPSTPPPSGPPPSAAPSTTPPPTRQQPTATPTATPGTTAVPPPSPQSPAADRPRVTILNNTDEDGLAERAKPIVEAAGFSVEGVDNEYREKPGSAPGSFNRAHTTVYYEEGQEADVEDLRVALAPNVDGEIETRLNDGKSVPREGPLVLVLADDFSA